jgi:hypothetical protein
MAVALRPCAGGLTTGGEGFLLQIRSGENSASIAEAESTWGPDPFDQNLTISYLFLTLFIILVILLIRIKC